MGSASPETTRRATDPPRPSPRAAAVYAWDALARPVPVLALAVLIANDHWLKHARLLPSWLTGKLSDVAGLVFFPLLALALLAAPVRAVRGAPHGALTLRAAALACAATAALFTAAKTSQRVADLLTRLPDALGIPSRLIADPSDLVALPALWLAYGAARRALREGAARRALREGAAAPPGSRP